MEDSLIKSQFFSFMSDCGVEPRDNDFEPILDGQIHRFSVAGDHHREKTGAYFIHADGWPNWGVMDYRKHSEMQKGKLDSSLIPESQKESYQDRQKYEQILQASRERAAERQKGRAEQERIARQHMLAEYCTIYENEKFYTESAQATHPYLRAKGITGKSLVVPKYGSMFDIKVKVNQVSDQDFCRVGDLLIPLSNYLVFKNRNIPNSIEYELHCKDNKFPYRANFYLQSLQCISATPDSHGKFPRKFYRHIPIEGCYCELIPYLCRANNNDGYTFAGKVDRLYICEGIATGLSILALTDSQYPVLCAMSCHNLLNVAKTWKPIIDKEYHKMRIIIAADHDESGLGIQKAQEVVDAGFAEREIHPPIPGYDWNDYYRKIQKGEC